MTQTNKVAEEMVAVVVMETMAAMVVEVPVAAAVVGAETLIATETLTSPTYQHS